MFIFWLRRARARRGGPTIRRRPKGAPGRSQTKTRKLTFKGQPTVIPDAHMCVYIYIYISLYIYIYIYILLYMKTIIYLNIHIIWGLATSPCKTGLFCTAVSAVGIPGSRNSGASLCMREFHPSKSRIGSGRTPNLVHSFYMNRAYASLSCHRSIFYVGGYPTSHLPDVAKTTARHILLNHLLKHIFQI